MRAPIRLLSFLLLSALLVGACRREPEFEQGATVSNGELTDPASGGAVSTAPVTPEKTSSPPAKPVPAPVEIDWALLELPGVTVEVSCQLDYREQHDEQPLSDFSKEGLRAALERCADRGVMRIRYRGKIDNGFVSLVERVTVTADDLHIDKRILDLDSPGGQVEDAMRAGDYIAESHWSIWVREGAICHSACVFVLAAGDTRMIAGQVGIHRIIRMSSTATTRAQLADELNVVYRRVRDYFQRNGTAPAVVDLMMAVPNRGLRLLSRDELQLYGLDGANPAQDDLDRLRLMRKCGEDFVARRDSFVRAFERQCKPSHSELDEINECGLAMRERYGFPDSTCPAESPLAEFDVPDEEVPQVDATDVEETGDEVPAGQDEVAPAEQTPVEQQPDQPSPSS